MARNWNRWHPETWMDSETIRRMYITGLSTRQIARKLGRSPSRVHEICKSLGISRDRYSAAVLRQPLKSKNPRTSRASARAYMEHKLQRKLSRSEHVHHIDGNPCNNAPENLVVMFAADHGRYHHPANPVPRSQREGRRAWQRQWYEAHKVKETCAWCGKGFLRYVHDAQKCCGHSCATRLMHKHRKEGKI